jgi:acyl-CoA thioester hydrolase
MEHARTDYLRLRDMAPPVLEERHGIVFVVAGMNIRYLAPARLGDELEIEAVLAEVGRAAVRFEQAVWLLEAGRRGRELTRAGVDVVCVNSQSFKPARIPAPVRECITRDS